MESELRTTGERHETGRQGSARPGAADVRLPEDQGELYARLALPMTRLAYLMVGDHQSAEDVWHEAFIRVSSRLRHVRAREATDSYVRRAVINEARDYARRRQRERRRVGRIHDDQLVRTRLNESVDEQQEEVWELVLKLPWRQRAAVILRYYEGLSEEDSALVLRCSSRAINSLASRALSHLRRTVESKPKEE